MFLLLFEKTKLSSQVLISKVTISIAGQSSTAGNCTSSSGTELCFKKRNTASCNKKVLTPVDIKILVKGLSFVAVPNMINEADLKRNFEEFERNLRCKWYFGNQITDDFSEIPACISIST